MAIMGFLVHCSTEACLEVQDHMRTLPELELHGIHKDNYIVAVADAPSEDMEALLAKVKAHSGVLTCYVTSLHLEDELP